MPAFGIIEALNVVEHIRSRLVEALSHLGLERLAAYSIVTSHVRPDLRRPGESQSKHMIQRPILQSLHIRVLDAYGKATIALSGTKESQRLWNAYEKAEKKFTAALPVKERVDPTNND